MSSKQSAMNMFYNNMVSMKRLKASSYTLKQIKSQKIAKFDSSQSYFTHKRQSTSKVNISAKSVSSLRSNDLLPYLSNQINTINQIGQSKEDVQHWKFLIVKLYEMGFHEDTVERAILFGGARSIEDCMPFLVPNENN